MSIRRALDVCYLCWLSKPKADRPLYSHLRRTPVRSIVELGVRSEERSLALLRMAQYRSPGEEIRYVGIDLFDARPADQPKLTLKQMHQAMNRSGATIRLIPGDAQSGLARCANQLQGTEMLIVSAGQDPDVLAKAWMYVPRLLGPNGSILVAEGPLVDAVASFRLLAASELENRSRESQRARRAA